MKFIKVTFLNGEFEEAFPVAAGRSDLSESDKVRLALGLEPRNAKPGAPKENKNAIGNVGRWGGVTRSTSVDRKKS